MPRPTRTSLRFKMKIDLKLTSTLSINWTVLKYIVAEMLRSMAGSSYDAKLAFVQMLSDYRAT